MMLEIPWGDNCTQDTPQNALQRYCESSGWHYQINKVYDPITAAVLGKVGNKWAWGAIEVVHDTNWTSCNTYPYKYIEITKFKLKCFADCLGANEKVSKVSFGYYFIFNTTLTYAAILRFRDILKCKNNKKSAIIYGKPGIIIQIPVEYIIKYINIPHQNA